MKSAITKIIIVVCIVIPFGSAGAQDIIDSVSPNSAAPGDTNVAVTIGLDSTLSMPPVPPAGVPVQSVTIGSVSATGFSRDSDYVISAVFDFPASASTGLFDLVVVFSGPSGDLSFTETDAFTIGSSGSLSVTILPADAVSAGAKWNVDGGSWQNSGATLSELAEGEHTVGFGAVVGWDKPADQSVNITADQTASATGTYTASTVSLTYPIADTGQDSCSDADGLISYPSSGEAFYGQDAQHNGYQFSYRDNGDGTVSDLVTGLVWQQTADADGDSDIDADDKLTYSGSQSYCANLSLAGHTDWRLPTIKELYSLIDFRGTDCSSYSGTDTSVLTPFIDNTVFDYNWGDTDAGERIIDSQYASNTLYVHNTANDGGSTMFGVNFADGRIKGYGLSIGGQDKTFFCMCVRENTDYGVNDFTDNSDGTITDNATGLMWAQNDNGSALNWEQALAWVEQQNAVNYLGYNDWRMPNAKELQSIVDYTRSPSTTNSAAIDPLFNATAVTNEAGAADYPYYWSSTTHMGYPSNAASAAYLSFGRAMGYMNYAWQDVHGAGAQRSDPKAPEDGVTYPNSHGPQGDSQRVYNYVRPVRDADMSDSVTWPLEDAVVILKILAGISGTQDWTDAVPDDKATISDAIYIIRKIAGL